MTEPLQHNFVVGNMATDLVKETIRLCGKSEDKAEKKTLRFPKYLYPSYVEKMISTSLKIHEYVCIANGIPQGRPERTVCQKKAMSECVHLEALICIALDFKWISQKQHDRWQKLTTDVHWKIYNWMKAKQG